jgi:hypothetical protein
MSTIGCLLASTGVLPALCFPTEWLIIRRKLFARGWYRSVSEFVATRRGSNQTQETRPFRRGSAATNGRRSSAVRSLPNASILAGCSFVPVIETIHLRIDCLMCKTLRSQLDRFYLARHEILATSLQSVATCHRNLGQDDRSLQWEKRAADCLQKSRPATAPPKNPVTPLFDFPRNRQPLQSKAA